MNKNDVREEFVSKKGDGNISKKGAHSEKSRKESEMSETDEPPVKKINSNKQKVKKEEEKEKRSASKSKSSRRENSRERRHKHSSSSKSHRRSRHDSREKHSKRSKHKKSHSRSVSSSCSSSSNSSGSSSNRRNNKERSKHRHRSSSRDRRLSSRKLDEPRRHSRHSQSNSRPALNEKTLVDSHQQTTTTKTTTTTTTKTENQEAKVAVNNSDLSQANVADLLKQIEVPKELRFRPQEAAKYQMEQLRKKTEELTGVKVPSFYNVTAVNPLQYAEQQKKRKLLWSKSKDNENTTTTIVGRAIVEGQDEKTAEKFRKLMGIKASSSDHQPHSADAVDHVQQMQKKAFDALDKEYQLARMTTHTHRGMGLGFATGGFIDPNNPARPK